MDTFSEFRVKKRSPKPGLTRRTKPFDKPYPVGYSRIMTVIDRLNQVDPSKLGFGTHFANVVLSSEFSKDRGWSPLEMRRGSLDLNISAASKVLHYAQEIFEGLKIFRKADGSHHYFRPLENIRRMAVSSEILAMPAFPEKAYMDGLITIAQELAHLVPEEPGALYIRPTMIGTSDALGVAPANQYLFFMIASPVGGYFGSVKSDKPAQIRVWISPHHVRAVRGGLGAAKAGANYAASLRAVQESKKLGFDNVLFLDAIERRQLEELSGMNVFVLDRGVLRTPSLGDTILKGVTRDSILKLAPSLGIEVSEEPILVDALHDGISSGRITEAFACGTGASITSISEFGWKDQALKLPVENPVTTRLYRELIDIQFGRKPDPKLDRDPWIVPIPKSGR